MDITFQSSVLFVTDIAASRHFYEDLLGQEVAMDHGPNVGYKGGFAIWQVDHAFQTIYQRVPASGEPKGEDPLGRDNLELYFETPQIEAAATKMAEAGVEFAHELREQPWGQRVLRVYDPDGHIVELAEPMPAVVLRFLGEGMTAAEVAQRTSMPLEIVQHFAQELRSSD